MQFRLSDKICVRVRWALGRLRLETRTPAQKKGANVSIPSHQINPERPSPPALAGQLATSNSVSDVPQGLALEAHPAPTPGPGEVCIQFNYAKIL
jgi:hypothetical protein